MNVGERMGLFTVVPSVPPGDAAANALVHAGDWVSLKNYNRCSVVLQIGDAAVSTRTLRLQQATSVAGAGAKALPFSAVWRTGARLYFDPATVAGTFQVGEEVAGANGVAVIHSIHADHFVVHSVDETAGAFVAGETVTGGTSGATADLTAAGFLVDEDILVRTEVAAGNTFVAPAVPNRTYVVEIAAPMLDVNEGYDCILADISAVGGADDTARSVTYILSEPRYKQDPMESAIYD